jgi:hypothetical protein
MNKITIVKPPPFEIARLGEGWHEIANVPHGQRSDALAAFDRSLENATPKHRNLTLTRVRRLVEAGGFTTLGDLEAERFEECLKALRKAEDMGAHSYNH